MAILYVDECGWTGSNLLDKAQPWFVVASLLLEDAQVSEWHGPLAAATQAPEVKYANLSGSPRGREAILQFVQTLDRHQERMRWQLIHKEYALLNKLLDSIVEPFYRANGRDYYLDGHNQGYANLLYYVSGDAPAETDLLLVAWRDLCRDPSPQRINDLEAATHVLAAKSPQLKVLCGPILYAIAWRRKTGKWDDVSKENLKLQVSSFVGIVRDWNQEQPGDLVIHADESSELKAGAEVIRALSDRSFPSLTFRDRDRKFESTLKVAELNLLTSIASPGVQLADVAAGMVNHAQLAIDELIPGIPGYSDRLVELVSQWPRMHQVIPEEKFTPEQLGKIGFDGSLLIDDSAIRMGYHHARKGRVPKP